MQQEASSKLNFRATKTMQIAQQLYEGVNVKKHGIVGLVTYIRTNSLRINKPFSSQLQHCNRKHKLNFKKSEQNGNEE